MVAMVVIQTNKALSWGMTTLASSPTKDLNSDSISRQVCYWGSGQAEWAHLVSSKCGMKMVPANNFIFPASDERR